MTGQTTTEWSRDVLEQTFDQVWQDAGGAGVLAAAEDGTWPAELWDRLAETELPWVSVPETHGGAGGEPAEGAAVWRSVGRTACPLPVGETALAGWLLAAAGLPVPHAPLSVVPDARTMRVARSTRGATLSGRARYVPWASEVDQIVGLAETGDGLAVFAVRPADLTVRRTRNLAGEPRDEIDAADAPVEVGDAPEWLGPNALRRRGALVRMHEMVGAMQAMLARTIAYTSEREQFGRPIGRFQAVRQLVVLAAAEVAAAGVAADVATASLREEHAGVDIARAMAVVGEAADTVTAHCHQVHGAIGMTREYPVQFWSRRLWSWRPEFGSVAFWRREVGRELLTGDPDDAWPSLSADPVAGGGR